MKVEELAYMAGLFDGEGCIHIARVHTKKHNLTYQLVCKVSMYSLSTLEMFKANFGGSIRKETIHETSNKYGLLHSWAIWGNSSVSFLKQLMPYLRIKKAEANLAFEFQSKKAIGASKGVWGNSSKTEEAITLEGQQYLLMRSLKRGGKNV